MPSKLPVLPQAPTIRPSSSSRWRAASLVLVHLLIAAHLAHWALAGRTLTPLEPSEAMAFGKAGVVNAGLLFFAAAILLTAVFGRFFCGWACHLVAVQDLARWLLAKVGIRPHPLRSRLLGWVPALAFVYMFLWPALFRLWHETPLGTRAYELTTSAFWATFPGWIVGTLTFLVCGFAIVYFLGAKGFCTYACPYGAAFALADRLAPMRVRVTDACEGCGHCTAVCTSNVRVHEEVRAYGMVVDPGCMKCRDCVSVCPNDALYVGLGKPALFSRPLSETRPRPLHPLSWPEEILTAVAFLLAFLAFRGLYGEVPFLMSLGIAGILAYLVLVAHRMIARDRFAWRRLELKRGGRLTRGGWVVATALLAVGALWAHAGILSVDWKLGELGFRRTAALRATALDPLRAPLTLAPSDRATVLDAAARFARIEHWGFFPWRGAASRRAWLAWLGGSAARTEGAALAALAEGDSPEEMGYLAARAALGRGDLDAARIAGARALAGNPRAPEPYSRLAVLLAQAGDPATAAAWLEAGTTRFPDSPLLLYNRALIAAMGGEIDQAVAGFRRVLLLDPTHQAARENLAGVLASAGRFDEAIVLFRQALEAAPEDVGTRLLLARALAGAGRNEEATAELDAVLRRQPGDPAALALREVLHDAMPPTAREGR